MALKIQEVNYERIFDSPEYKRCDLFVETRQWAIDNNIDNPVMTAIMRVAIDILLTSGVPQLMPFRESLVSFVFLAKEIEMIGSGITQNCQKKGKKLAEIREQLMPFGIFNDAYEGTLEVEGLIYLTGLTARVVEVVASYFGKNINQLLQKSEDSLCFLSSQFAGTIVKVKDIARDSLTVSLDSLGRHLKNAGKELREIAYGDSDAQIRALNLDMLGGWASAAADALKNSPKPLDRTLLMPQVTSENYIKRLASVKPHLITPYYVTLPEMGSASSSSSSSQTYRLGNRITAGAIALGGSTGLGVSTTLGGLTISGGGTLTSFGVSVSGPFSAVGLPVAGGILLGYQLVQFYNDFELKRRMPYEHYVPMTSAMIKETRKELLKLYKLSEADLSTAQAGILDSYIVQLDWMCQELKNAIRRTMIRKNTSWGGSGVRVAVSIFNRKDNGTVKAAQKIEKKYREKIAEIQASIHSFLKGIHK